MVAAATTARRVGELWVFDIVITHITKDTEIDFFAQIGITISVI